MSELLEINTEDPIGRPRHSPSGHTDFLSDPMNTQKVFTLLQDLIQNIMQKPIISVRYQTQKWLGNPFKSEVKSE